MLPEEEYRPTAEALTLFERALSRSARRLALAAGVATEKILSCRGSDPVLVSLCQTGTRSGSCSAVGQPGGTVQHCGTTPCPWCAATVSTTTRWPTFSTATTARRSSSSTVGPARAPSLVSSQRHSTTAVGATAPHRRTAWRSWSTRVTAPRSLARADDFLVPNACLNATVSGLVSRTVVTPGLVRADDFHGAKYYPELRDRDLSLYFLDTVSREFPAVRREVEVDTAEHTGTGGRRPSPGNGTRSVWRPSTTFPTSISSRRASVRPSGCCCTGPRSACSSTRRRGRT